MNYCNFMRFILLISEGKRVLENNTCSHMRTFTNDYYSHIIKQYIVQIIIRIIILIMIMKIIVINLVSLDYLLF